jgi:hypothetical protein
MGRIPSWDTLKGLLTIGDASEILMLTVIFQLSNGLAYPTES